MRETRRTLWDAQQVAFAYDVALAVYDVFGLPVHDVCDVYERNSKRADNFPVRRGYAVYIVMKFRNIIVEVYILHHNPLSCDRRKIFIIIDYRIIKEKSKESILYTAGLKPGFSFYKNSLAGQCTERNWICIMCLLKSNGKYDLKKNY
jgi:hypothetical protein